MKSFNEFLRSRLEFGERIDQTRKPVFRSSGIFPVIKNNFFSTKIMFLGYWMLKRNIPDITSLITLRDKNGGILTRNYFPINEPKTYNVELNEILDSNNISHPEFLGSIEIEFFSSRDMVYPYPALVLNYYNQQFNTCVHTIGRVYNDFEDLMENEKFSVPETGFDIYSTDDLTSFLSFVNGPLENENPNINYVVSNYESEKISGKIKLKRINPYETIFLKFDDYIHNLSEFLKGSSGSISIEHNFKGFYTRFLVGNIQNSFPSVSFTHSYYDCTSCSNSGDYWDRISEGYHHASIYIPLFTQGDKFTELILYPNFSPCKLDLQIDLHDNEGNLLKKIPHLIPINTQEFKLSKINFNQILKEHGLELNNVKTAHIITNSQDNKIPARLKFGLNVGTYGKKAKLPCNICFNSTPGNPILENKPGSFHWCPVFINGHSIISIGNFSQKKEYLRSSQITLSFYRAQDNKSMKMEIEVPPNGEFRFELENYPDVKSFLQDNDGWITVKANNPNISGFYFNFHSSGAVAGDHFF